VSAVRLRIKELRRERGMSIDDLEKATGLHFSTLYRYERNKVWPRPDEWELLAKALSVQYFELLEGAPLVSIHREPDLQAA
jgi:transcriptional regulator with XRE-family HTH domain